MIYIRNRLRELYEKKLIQIKNNIEKGLWKKDYKLYKD